MNGSQTNGVCRVEADDFIVDQVNQEPGLGLVAAPGDEKLQVSSMTKSSLNQV